MVTATVGLAGLCGSQIFFKSDYLADLRHACMHPDGQALSACHALTALTLTVTLETTTSFVTLG